MSPSNHDENHHQQNINQLLADITWRAVYSGDLSQVEILVAAGTNIKRVYQNSCTLLHLAAYRGHVALVNYLITKGLNVNAATNDGHTAIHYAVQKGAEEVVRRLIAAGAKLEAVNGRGHTALHQAAYRGAEEIAKHLIEAGANVNVNSKQGQSTPLHLAAVENHLNLVELLVTAGAKIEAVNGKGHTALHQAAYRGAEEIAKRLIKASANVNVRTKQRGNTPLYLAVANNHVNLVKLLVTAGAKIEAVNKHGYTALHQAAYRGAEEIARYLITVGANVDVQAMKGGITPLHLAVVENQPTLGELLVKNRGSVNQQLREACEFKQKILERGMNSLHLAILMGHVRMVEYLANHADLHGETERGNTPLSLATAGNSPAITQCIQAALQRASYQNGQRLGKRSPEAGTAADPMPLKKLPFKKRRITNEEAVTDPQQVTNCDKSYSALTSAISALNSDTITNEQKAADRHLVTTHTGSLKATLYRFDNSWTCLPAH